MVFFTTQKNNPSDLLVFILHLVKNIDMIKKNVYLYSDDRRSILYAQGEKGGTLMSISFYCKIRREITLPLVQNRLLIVDNTEDMEFIKEIVLSLPKTNIITYNTFVYFWNQHKQKVLKYA